VDGVRLPKQAYYVCQTMFRDDPQVHIIGHWNYPAGTKKTVYVTSNCQAVKLYVNGKAIGETNAVERYLFVFPDVSWQAGDITAVAFNHDEPVATNRITTAGAAVALRLTAITGPGGLRADGSDVVLIDVEAVDAKGERCPTFEQRVNFTCDGPGIWRGGYDSGQAGSINHKHLNLEAGINRVAVRSTLEAGAIEVTANCAGLRPGSVIIPSHGLALADGYTRVLPREPRRALPAAHPDWSQLARGTPAMRVTTAAAGGPEAGRYTEAFSYTGPTELVHVERGARAGRNVYCDRDEVFPKLPAELAGADWVQAAAADRDYSAADLMQLAVRGGTTVYVAHDPALGCPEWLQRQFHATSLAVNIGGRTLTVYQRRLKTDESLTLGANSDGPPAAAADMYLVFIKRDPRFTSAEN
jgi:beta-galactosidase